MTNTQNNADMPELLPCPFCNCATIFVTHYNAATCTDCGAEAAMQSWNTRSPSPVAEGDKADALKAFDTAEKIHHTFDPSMYRLEVVLTEKQYTTIRKSLSAPSPGDDLAGMIEYVVSKTHASVSFVRLGDKDWTVISGGHYTGTGVDPKSAFTDSLNKMGGAPVKTLREENLLTKL